MAAILKHGKSDSNEYVSSPAVIGNFYLSSANLKYYARSFQYEGTILWNNISGSIQQSTSTSVFKSRYMKNYFTQ